MTTIRPNYDDQTQNELCSSFKFLVDHLTPDYFEVCAQGDPARQRELNAMDLRDLATSLEQKPDAFERHHLSAIAALCNWLL